MNFNRDYKYLNFMITSSNQIPEFNFFQTMVQSVKDKEIGLHKVQRYNGDLTPRRPKTPRVANYRNGRLRVKKNNESGF